VDELTEAFMEARYGRHPIETSREKEVRTHWQLVKKALQQRSKQLEEQKNQ